MERWRLRTPCCSPRGHRRSAGPPWAEEQVSLGVAWQAGGQEGQRGSSGRAEGLRMLIRLLHWPCTRKLGCVPVEKCKFEDYLLP